MKPRMTTPRPDPRRHPDGALHLADAMMRTAKEQFSAAALACIRQRPDAEAQVRMALAAVDRARAGLRLLADEANE